MVCYMFIFYYMRLGCQGIVLPSFLHFLASTQPSSSPAPAVPPALIGQPAQSSQISLRRFGVRPPTIVSYLLTRKSPGGGESVASRLRLAKAFASCESASDSATWNRPETHFQENRHLAPRFGRKLGLQEQTLTGEGLCPYFSW